MRDVWRWHSWWHWIRKLQFVVTGPVCCKQWKKSALFSLIQRKWTKKSVTAEAWTLHDFNKMKDLKVHCFLQRCLDFQGERYLPSDFLGANMITLPIRPGCAGIILLLPWQSALLFQGVTVNCRFLRLGFAWSKYYPLLKNWIVQPVRCAIPGMLHKYISPILPCWREETTLTERLFSRNVYFNCAIWIMRLLKLTGLFDDVENLGYLILH